MLDVLFLFVCVLLMKGRCHEGGVGTVGQCSDGGEIAPGLIKARNLLLRMRSDHEIGCLESVIALPEPKWLLFG